MRRFAQNIQLLAVLGFFGLGAPELSFSVPPAPPVESFIKPEPARPVYAEGLDLSKHGKHREAISEYQKARRTRPSDSDIVFLMGLSYAALGEFDKALQNFDEALWFAKYSLTKEEDILTEKARVQMQQGDSVKAIATVTQALAKNPSHIPARVLKSSVAKAMGNRAEAIRVLRDPVPQAPVPPEYSYALADALLGGADRLFHKADIDEAISILRPFAQNPTDGIVGKEISMLYVRALIAKGDLAQAQKLLDREQKRFPEDTELATLERQLAIEHRAVASTPAASS